MLRTFLVATILSATTCLTALAQNQPLLTDELREAFEDGGASAVKDRFDEIWPAQKAEYDANPTSLMTFRQEIAQSGDMEALNVLAEINTTVMQDAISMQMLEGAANYEDVTDDLETAIVEQEARDAAEEDAAFSGTSQQQPGTPRDDLGRFSGLYAKADDPPMRSVFVSETCDGYLAASPLWADIAPWRMRSATDTVFTYSDAFMAFAMEFEVDEDGIAVALSHDIEGIESPLVRIDDLPAEYSECLPEPTR